MKIHRDFPLSEILFYKIGGMASHILEARSRDDIIEAFNFIKKNNIQKWFIVGLGSNLLVNDTPFAGAVIWIREGENPQFAVTQEGLIQAYAGETLDSLTQYAFAQGFINLENLGGLPTTIGGAIHGNAGAFGIEMKHVVEKVEVFDTTTGNIRTFNVADCEFDYRDSVFKQDRNLLILQGFFRLQKSDVQSIANAKKIYREQIAYREANHPVEYPSCGSVFKNIIDKEKVAKIVSIWPDTSDLIQTKWHGKVSMGYIIKRLGLAGLQIGGAQISEKHANYISNVTNAKFTDVITLIDKIKEGFYNTFGFYPELEVEIIK